MPDAGPVAPPRGGTPGSAPPTGVALVETGVGFGQSGLDGPEPAPGTCRWSTTPTGYSLPDPHCTPGAVDSAVTAANLSSTICRSGGYTASVRAPESLTAPAKRALMSAYSAPGSTKGYELDHLVPLGLGGSNDLRNLWPQPDQGKPGDFDPSDPFGINAKDGVENALHAAVCSGGAPLAAAQVAVATDWTTALSRLGLS